MLRSGVQFRPIARVKAFFVPLADSHKDTSDGAISKFGVTAVAGFLVASVLD